ncbi:MAG: UDP-N-acetylmuramate dehydrogenase [Patescibacteria group bacterium]
MIKIKENVSLEKYTTFNIGGKAKYFVEVHSMADIKEAVKFAKENELEYFVLAGGSNVLFSDDGFNGLVIWMHVNSMVNHGGELMCGAGTKLMDLLTFAAENNLTGGENLTGIPGSVGGAVRGNAGAFGTEIKDVLKEVYALNIKTGESRVVSNAECDFSYRSSYFKKNPNCIIVSVTFDFKKGDKKKIEAAMYNIISKRNSKQIQDIKSAGSFFVNPVVSEDLQKKFEIDTGAKSNEGRVPAGWLLESCGLFKKRVGGIQAGIQHANYFINIDEGTAEEALQLSAIAKTRVRDEFDVQLKEEVVLVGF